MTPARYDLNLYRGDTYQWRFELYDDSNRLVPTDLSDCSVAAEFREASGGVKIVDFVCIVTLPNIIDMSLPVEEWPDTARSGVWDLELAFGDGRVRTPVAGTVTVTPDVTNSVVIP